MNHSPLSMNLRNLSNTALLSQIQSLVSEERRATTQILHYLREVARRKLFAQKGFPSLFEFVVKELGYSEASASRRINAMRVLQELPDVAESIEKGTLSLSNVSSVHTFLKREERQKNKSYTQEEKREVLRKMENQSHRECEKILLELSPGSAKPQERTRRVSAHATELKVIVDSKLLEKLEKIKGLLAHSHPSLSWAELLELLAERTLEQIDPMRQAERLEKKKNAPRPEKRNSQATVSNQTGAKGQPATVATVSTLPGVSGGLATPAPPAPESSSFLVPRRKAIPAALRRQVWVKEGGRCTFQDPRSGTTCGSQFAVQIDHIIPVAFGGKNELTNLQIRCRNHNIWEGVEKLGHAKMAGHVPTMR